MSEENQSTSELKEGEIVFRVVFIADNQAAEIVEPGKETFDSPALAVTAQPTAIVEGRFGPSLAVRGQEHDAFGEQLLAERIAVVGFVADQTQRFFLHQTLLEGCFDQSHFGGRSSFGKNGERKTMSISNGHDFDALAPLGFADRSAPFLAALKLPSMKHSERSNPPRS